MAIQPCTCHTYSDGAVFDGSLIFQMGGARALDFKAAIGINQTVGLAPHSSSSVQAQADFLHQIAGAGFKGQTCQWLALGAQLHRIVQERLHGLASQALDNKLRTVVAAVSRLTGLDLRHHIGKA